MRIAFIGHSLHQRTRSSGFFVEKLESIGEVSFFWDDTGLSSENVNISSIIRSGYDLIVLWQIEKYAPLLARSGHPNVVFVPMYDGCKDLPEAYWRACRGLKLLAFSSTLYERFQRFGLVTEYFQYFPNPGDFPEIEKGDDLHGFFWQRKQDITWQTIRPLLDGTDWQHISMHTRVDPEGGKFVRPSEEEISQFRIEFLDWLPQRADFLAQLRRCNVYFCPRLEEGIGMSFLEAMAMGMAVIAPRRPTMTEYIVDGLNGILYEPTRDKPIDWGTMNAVRMRARDSVQQGYEEWRRAWPRLLDFLLTPSSGLQSTANSAPRWFEEPGEGVTARPSPPVSAGGDRTGLSGGARSKGVLRSGTPKRPLITIATVVLNARAVLEDTLRSGLGQSYPNKEIIVLDGRSTDGTLDLIRAYDDVLDFWESAPDEGPYDAMNKAAALARGDWIIFLNAGDWFESDDAIERAFRAAPDDVDFVYGHHVYLTVNGVREIHRAAFLDRTWERLHKGDIEGDWLTGIPGHQATFTRTRFLRQHPYDTRYRIAADHDLLFRAAQQGARSFHANVLISTYVGGGLSWTHWDRCLEEWELIGKKFSRDPARVARHYQGIRLATDLQKPATNRWIGRVSGHFLRNPVSFLKSLRALGCKRIARRIYELVSSQRRRIVFDFCGSNRFFGSSYRAVNTINGQTVFLFSRWSPCEFTGYLEGFSAPEPWGVWTQGPGARITPINSLGPRVEVTVEIVQVPSEHVGKRIRLLAGNSSFDYNLKSGKQTVCGVIDAGTEVGSLHLEVPWLADLPRSIAEGQAGTMRVAGALGIRRITLKAVA